MAAVKERLECVGEDRGRQVLACLGTLSECNETKAQKVPSQCPEHPTDLTNSLLKRAVIRLLDFGGGRRGGGGEEEEKKKQVDKKEGKKEVREGGGEVMRGMSQMQTRQTNISAAGGRAIK